MTWSWKLGRIAGINVYVHATFLILIVWIAASFWQAEHSVAAVLGGIGFILAIFACVVLHELGHSLTARRYGIRTRRITLLPIGGIAALERMPDDPKQEMIVALAGPAVNVAIAMILFLWITATGGFFDTATVNLANVGLSERLFAVNVMLAAFNMLPALPMDGGRVFRAALATRMDHYLATERAARIGQGFGLAFGFLGLLYNPFLIFIGLFVWIGAATELHTEKLRVVMAGATVGDIMQTDYKTLAPGDHLTSAIELTLSGSQKDFPVRQGEEIVGVLTQAELLKGLATGGEGKLVKDCMHRDLRRIEGCVELKSYWQESSSQLLNLQLVTDNGRVVGILDFDNFSEFARIQSALHSVKT